MVETPEAAVEAARAIQEMTGTKFWVVKAQIHAGGRGKGGGVKLAKNLDEVRERQHALAEEQLARARRRVDQGEVAPIEVLRAQSGIGRTIEQLIVADNQLRLRARALKRFMNAPQFPVDGPTMLDPAFFSSASTCSSSSRHVSSSAEVKRGPRTEVSGAPPRKRARRRVIKPIHVS